MLSLGQWSLRAHLGLTVIPSRSCPMELQGGPRFPHSRLPTVWRSRRDWA